MCENSVETDQNLHVWDGAGQLVFAHAGHWLHPLFALHEYLNERKPDVSGWRLEDKIVGRGAAVLIASAGIKVCHARMLSELALPVLEAHGVSVTWDRKVESLLCMTERLIKPCHSLEEALELLWERKRLADGKNL